MAAYNLITNDLLRIFPSKKVAAAQLGVSQVKIEFSIRGRTDKPCGNMKWRYYFGEPIDCKYD